MTPLWSGRFEASPAEALWAFTVDIETDMALWPYDIAVNRAHVRMLGDVGILASADVAALLAALDVVEAELAAGEFEILPGDEDIHMAIERRLSEIAADAGPRIHTGRSRNDQVATDFRLWCRSAARDLQLRVDGLSEALCAQALANADVIAPGYTHLQRAQPITLGHALLAHVEAFDRDAGRFVDALARNDTCPLGAGALATTTLPIDPSRTAAELGFAAPFRNSVDAVASRDFVAELLAAAAICAVNLSRLAEEVVLWASTEFGFLRLHDAWATGSSMMPQKKNPDVAELARATAGRTLGAFVSIQTVTKALPLAYNRDMQEDKAATMQALRRLDLGLAAMTGLVASSVFDAARLEAAAAGGDAAATDLAERLVTAGVAFREAHTLVGSLVGRLAAQSRGLETVTEAELSEVHPALAGCSGDWLSPRASVLRRKHSGGPHPDAVARAVDAARARIAARA
jgi:argininosuccinate lyase